MSIELPFAERHLNRVSTVASTIKINNPFKNQLLEDVDEWARSFAHLISDCPSEELLRLFRIAGRISFNPRGWQEGVGGQLSDHEEQILQHERAKRVHQQPKTTKLTVVVLWLSSIIQGWIQSTLNGANLNWWIQTDLGDPSEDASALWWYSATNAIVFFTACVACGLSDPLQSRLFGRIGLGRRDVLFIAASISFASSIGAACVSEWTHLLACRVLLGISMGMKASVTSIFAAEISTCHLRGTIVMGWQAGDTLGIFLGFTANLIATAAVGKESSWRWQTASVAIPSLILMILVWAIPDSPRLYLKKGEYAKAFTAMCQLRHTPLQAARDLFYANAQLQVESEKMLKHIQLHKNELPNPFYPAVQTYQEKVKKLRWWNRVGALVTNRRTRRALQSALIVMIAQQLCGFNVLAFYSNSFFDSISPNSHNAITTGLLSWGIGGLNFLLTIPAFWLIDPFGRVSLLFATYPAMIVFMFATTLTFACATRSNVPKTAIEVLVFFFTAAFALGQGPVAFTYSAEVFPLLYRESGMSVAVAANLFGAGILTMFVPRAQFVGQSSWPSSDDFNVVQAKMLGTFVGLEVLALLLIFLFVPETAHCTPSYEEELNHLSLEELNSIFEQPTLHHTHYRIRAAFPSWLKRVRYRLFHRFVELNERDLIKPPYVYRWTPNDNDTEMHNITNRTNSSSSDPQQQVPVSAALEESPDTNSDNDSRIPGHSDQRRPMPEFHATGGLQFAGHEQQTAASPEEEPSGTNFNNHSRNQGQRVQRKPVPRPQPAGLQQRRAYATRQEQTGSGPATPTSIGASQDPNSQNEIDTGPLEAPQRTLPALPPHDRLSLDMYDFAEDRTQGRNGQSSTGPAPPGAQQNTVPTTRRHGHLSFDMYDIAQRNRNQAR